MTTNAEGGQNSLAGVARRAGEIARARYVVLILLLLGVILIHINSYALPHSVVIRHVVLTVFIGIASYYAYQSRRRHLEEYERLKKYLRVCSWCKKICYTNPDTKEEEWVAFEEYMAREHKFKSSHGICRECLHHVNIYSDSERDTYH